MESFGEFLSVHSYLTGLFADQKNRLGKLGLIKVIYLGWDRLSGTIR